MATSELGAFERLERFAVAARFYIEAIEAHAKGPSEYTETAMRNASRNYDTAKRAFEYTPPDFYEN